MRPDGGMGGGFYILKQRRGSARLLITVCESFLEEGGVGVESKCVRLGGWGGGRAMKGEQRQFSTHSPEQFLKQTLFCRIIDVVSLHPEDCNQIQKQKIMDLIDWGHRSGGVVVEEGG